MSALVSALQFGTMYQRHCFTLAPFTLALLASCTSAPKRQAAPMAQTASLVGPASASGPLLASQGHVEPFLERYCLSCHGHGKSKGGLSLEGFAHAAPTPEQQEVWQEVLERVESKDMPPEDHVQPSEGERRQLANWITASVFRTDCANPDPGRVTMRRLNRVEYQNTMADLLGVDLPLAQYLPPDDSGHGFDNLADVLTMSPLLMERYLNTADMALSTVVFDAAKTQRLTQKLSADLVEVGAQARARGDGWIILRTYEEDDVAVPVDVPDNTAFVLRVRASLYKPAPVPVQIAFMVDDVFVQTYTVTSKRTRVYETRMPVPPGRHRLRVVLLKDKSGLSPFEVAAPKTGKAHVGEVLVGQLELDGPIDLPKQPGPLHRRIFFAAPLPGHEADAAQAILRRFTERAFRRPVQDHELEALVGLAQQSWSHGATFEAGITEALRAVLVSPRFLFRIDTYGPEIAAAAGPVDEFALASRLSYFLWSSMPDTELLVEARAGRLRKNLRAQVTRMLAHPRARALVDDFAGQWLQLRSIEGVAPAFFMYRNFDEPLRVAMKEETSHFMANLMREDLSIMEILNADYSFINARLARHYGMEGVMADAFERVSLKGTPRRGVLTHGSILTITSTSTRTSPVKRGLWVLETLLNAPPPPAPPDVPSLAEGKEAKGTLRQRLEAHRANPACATCHARMDPIGFGLERFDAVGNYRTQDSGEPIDDTGTLTSGESFRGAQELINLLASTKQEEFARAFAHKLLTYALGRGLEPADRCAVDAVVTSAAQAEHRFSSFIHAVVSSVPFQKTRGTPNRESSLAQHEEQP